MNDTLQTTTHKLRWSRDVEDVGAGIIRVVASLALHRPWWGSSMLVTTKRVIIGEPGDQDALLADHLPGLFTRLEDEMLTRHASDRGSVDVGYHPDLVAMFAHARVGRLLAAGELSPAAADMDPVEVLWQYAEANALEGDERDQVLAFTQDRIINA